MRRNDSAALSGWCCPVRHRPAAVAVTAAMLILVAACSLGGTSAGAGGPASTSLTPRQAVLAAATEARQTTSATETVTFKDSGASSSTLTGTIRIRLKPTLVISEDLKMTAAGTSTRIKAILGRSISAKPRWPARSANRG